MLITFFYIEGTVRFEFISQGQAIKQGYHVCGNSEAVTFGCE